MGSRRLAFVAVVVVAAVFLAALAGCGSNSSSQTESSMSPRSDTHTAASDIVHATKTGKRYHRAGCSSLSRSDIPMTREEAEAKGLTPCKVCKP